MPVTPDASGNAASLNPFANRAFGIIRNGNQQRSDAVPNATLQHLPSSPCTNPIVMI